MNRRENIVMTRREGKRMVHATKRFLERYGGRISKRGMEIIKKKIEAGHGSFLTNIGKGSLWMVCYDGKCLFPIYENETKEIVTFLPKGSYEAQKVVWEKKQIEELKKIKEEEEKQERKRKIEEAQYNVERVAGLTQRLSFDNIKFK